MSTPPLTPPAAQSNEPLFLSDPVVTQIKTLSKYAFLAAVLTRAPTQAFLNKMPLIETPILAAAGYVLVFGPLAIAISMWWIAFTFRGGAIQPEGWTRGDLRFTAIVFAAPAILSAFIAFQFFILFAKPGECNTASRVAYLIETGGGFQPEYCMSISLEAAKSMPYLLEPLFVQAWLQIALPIITALLTRRLWTRWRGPRR